MKITIDTKKIKMFKDIPLEDLPTELALYFQKEYTLPDGYSVGRYGEHELLKVITK